MTMIPAWQRAAPVLCALSSAVTAFGSGQAVRLNDQSPSAAQWWQSMISIERYWFSPLLMCSRCTRSTSACEA